MGIEVVPINGFIGAEIRGADLSKLDDASFQVIHDALVKYEVIVLRRQRIALEDQMAFGRRFGDLVVHPFSFNLEDKPEVIVLDYSADHPANRTDIWHADETYRAAPPMGTILRARVIPAQGGDTCFSSMTAAYRGLSERMKRHIHGLEALHDFKPFRSLFGDSPEDRKKLRQIEDEWPNPWHPVVRVHPVSGRRAIYVNRQFTLRIKDLKEDEGRALLEFLYAQASIPEYQLRVKWEVDTVVMWDNRSVLHYAPHDYYPQRRTMERVTVSGDRPLGVAGDYTPETVEGLGQVNPNETSRKAPVRQFQRGSS
jgi:taurine dioxygenase